LLGASIAFPVGLMIGREETSRRNAAEPSRPEPVVGGSRTARNPYSPRISDDPYVVEEQRKVLRALEAGCRQLKQHCDEARQARRLIEKAEARR